MISATLLSFLEALFCAFAGTACAYKLAKNYNWMNGRKKYLLLIVILLPLVTPPLLSAYVYSSFSINFQTQPLLNEFLYLLLMTAKGLPVAFLALLIFPLKQTPSAEFCERLLKSNQKIKLAGNQIAAFALSTIYIFHDYEIASLLRIRHWSVVLFNAHAGGLVLNLAGSFQMAALPAFITVTFIGIFLIAFKNCSNQQFKIAQKPTALSWLIPLFFTILTTLLPLVFLLSQSTGGFADIFSSGWMVREFTHSVLLSSVTTLCCLCIALALTRFSKGLAFTCSIPGLFGALILGLLFIGVFNLTVLSAFKSTVIPLISAMIVYGLPFALVTVLMLQKQETSYTLNLLPAASAKEVHWISVLRPSILITLPLFCILWFDLTLSSMLAPASVTTLFPRLYNLMHYSENEKLSASVIVTCFIPLLIYLAIISAGNLFYRRK